MKKKVSSQNERAELNPFKRRECKPVVMWDVGKRSPKKEPKQEDEKKVEMETMDLNTPDAKISRPLHEIVDVTKLVQDIATAVTSGGRLAAAQRACSRVYAKNPISKIWNAQIPSNHQGEVMSFDEWKRRVAEEEGDVDMADQQ